MVMRRVDLEEVDDVSEWLHERTSAHDDWSTEWTNHVLTGERYILYAIEDDAFRERVVMFIDSMWRSAGLEPSERELVILAVAAELDSRPLWQQHVRVGLETRLSRPTIRALSDGDRGQLGERHRALARFATSFVQGTVTDTDYEILKACVDNETVVGTGLLAASYVTFERVLRTLKIDVTEEFVGWKLANI